MSLLQKLSVASLLCLAFAACEEKAEPSNAEKAKAAIKETTKSIKFTAQLSDDNKSAKAKITVDRSEFNVRYGSGSFFDNLGDKTIYDEFDLEVNLVVE